MHSNRVFIRCYFPGLRPVLKTMVIGTAKGYYIYLTSSSSSCRPHHLCRRAYAPTPECKIIFIFPSVLHPVSRTSQGYYTPVLLCIFGSFCRVSRDQEQGSSKDFVAHFNEFWNTFLFELHLILCREIGG